MALIMIEAASMKSLAARFFDAIERGEIASVSACYHDDVVVWHNTGGGVSDKADNLAVLRRLVAITMERTYSNRIISVFDGGFVEQHCATLRMLDGTRHSIDACIVCRVQDGQIIRLEEYFDDAQVAPVRASALAYAQSSQSIA